MGIHEINPAYQNVEKELAWMFENLIVISAMTILKTNIVYVMYQAK